MREHLSDALLSALADGELSAEQMAEVNEHLAGCSACTRSALTQMLLKSATAKVGQRYALPEDVRARLLQKASAESREPKTAEARGKNRIGGWMGWAAAAALLVAFAGTMVVQRGAQQDAVARLEEAALLTEVCDQHVAAMAANAAPQVVSSDRHTVKPWFQGKLPFSFNLPESLPHDVTLDGANLTYLHRRPVAQLLYSVGKHKASVFVGEREGAVSAEAAKSLKMDERGFHVAAFSTKDLDFVAVSDVDPSALNDLASAIQAAQNR
jgi:anti-sigma factor RsiW